MTMRQLHDDCWVLVLLTMKAILIVLTSPIRLALIVLLFLAEWLTGEAIRVSDLVLAWKPVRPAIFEIEEGGQ